MALTQVQRQTVREYRDAVDELRRSPESGFEKLESIGAIREVAHADRAEVVAKAFREVQNNQGGLASVLIVCPTYEEINRITEAIRTDRKMQRQLGATVQTTRHVALLGHCAEE